MALATSLISYWKLDEASGNAADSVGSNTLTNTGSMTYNTGKVNNAAYTSNTGPKYLTITNASQTGLNVSGDYSVSCWAWFDSATASTYSTLVSKYAAGQDGQPNLRVNSTDTNLYLYVVGVQYAPTTTKFWATGVWIHIVVTYTSGTGIIKFYKNGAYLTGEDATGPAALVSSTGNFSIGNLGDGTVSNDAPNGRIDEVGVWNRVLTAAEVTSLYNGGAGFPYPFVSSSVVPVPTLSLLGAG